MDVANLRRIYIYALLLLHCLLKKNFFRSRSRESDTLTAEEGFKCAIEEVSMQSTQAMTIKETPFQERFGAKVNKKTKTFSLITSGLGEAKFSPP